MNPHHEMKQYGTFTINQFYFQKHQYGYNTNLGLSSHSRLHQHTDMEIYFGSLAVPAIQLYDLYLKYRINRRRPNHKTRVVFQIHEPIP